jgi:hypothetical protein
MTESRNAYKMLVGKSDKKKPFRRTKRRWEDDIIGMDLREMLWKGVDWIHLAQDKVQQWLVVNTVLNIRVP